MENIKREFEDIRPYTDDEVNPALRRITADPVFPTILDYLFPEKLNEEIISEINGITSAIEFQKKFMHPAIRSIVEQTSTGLTYSGFDNIDPEKAYLFIANHRDILLDSAILQILLVENNFETSEITFGSNLMTSGFVIDFGKVNRMFKVIRDGSRREMFENSKKLSAYIRYKIIEKNTSLWIAQRKGRTKDGNDKTETALLKMLSVSGNGSVAENLKEINIVPISISYEYEPCDVSKTKELYFSLNGQYKKENGEDLNSIISGITQQKGRIHFSVGIPLDNELHEIEENADHNIINRVTQLIDEQIYQNYYLWKTNYIAYELLFNDRKYLSKFSSEDMANFREYLKTQLGKVKGDKNVLEKIFLRIYANPILNKNNHNI